MFEFVYFLNFKDNKFPDWCTSFYQYKLLTKEPSYTFYVSSTKANFLSQTWGRN